MNCKECGKELPDTANFCIQCGTSQREDFFTREPGYFRAWRLRTLKFFMTFCAVGIIVGIFFTLPTIWILCLIGFLIGIIKLLTLPRRQ